jgi:hypothetical protein
MTDIAPIPRAVELAIERLAPGWRHKTTHGTGQITKKPTDPDTRKQIEVQLDVRSIALHLRHTNGRAAVAMWVATWTPEREVPARWTERKATKRLGARSVHIPAQVVAGEWKYSFDQAYTWDVCVDPGCPRAGTDHAADLPRTLKSTELAAFVSTPAAVQELEIAA